MNPSRPSVPPRPLLAVLAALSVAAASGCAGAQRTASSRSPSVETLADGSQIVCEGEMPTGSHISEQVCRRVLPPALDRARTQTQLAIPKSDTIP